MRYSIEPPRTDLVAYHSYDTVEMDRVIDESPQANDAKITNEVALGVDGIVGNGAKMLDRNTNVEIFGIDEHLPMGQTTVSTWARGDTELSVGSWVLRFTITDSGGTVHEIQHTAEELVDGWIFGTGTYDGEKMRLYYAEADKEGIEVVASQRVSAEVHDYSLEFHISGQGYVDESRVYRTALDKEQVGNLFEIGVGQQFRQDIVEGWDQPGIPIRGKNLDLASTLAERFDLYRRDIDAILQARQIDYASGEWLDLIGRRVGVSRKTGESDDKYRIRLKARMQVGQSSGTFEDLLSIGKTLVDTKAENIEFQPNYTSEPATATMYVGATDVNDSPFTDTEIADLMNDAVPGGHRIDIVVSSLYSFELVDDSMSNDANEGLTSDSVSTGGGLASTL